jgi:hypothetical protein
MVMNAINVTAMAMIFRLIDSVMTDDPGFNVKPNEIVIRVTPK